MAQAVKWNDTVWVVELRGSRKYSPVYQQINLLDLHLATHRQAAALKIHFLLHFSTASHQIHVSTTVLLVPHLPVRQPRPPIQWWVSCTSCFCSFIHHTCPNPNCSSITNSVYQNAGPSCSGCYGNRTLKVQNCLLIISTTTTTTTKMTKSLSISISQQLNHLL